MADYYSAGRLISQEIQHIVAKRSLTGATQEDVWGGTALTRPAPGGAQVEVVSTSPQDAAEVTDTWTVTIGGGVTQEDVVQITVDGTAYAYQVQGTDTTATIAEALKTALMTGSTEIWQITPGGAADAGDTWRTTIDGVDYDFVAVGGEALPALALGIQGALAACPYYIAALDGPLVILTATSSGGSPDVSVSMVADGNASGSVSAMQIVAGVNATTAATATRLNSVVTIESATPGAGGVLVVSSSYTTDPGADSTAVAAHTLTGAVGTGITGLRIAYLDANGKQQVETIATTGLTAAATAAMDLERILSVTSTGGAAAGTITIRGAGAGTEYDTIAAGDCQTFSGDCAVPSNRNGGLVKSLVVSASTASEIYLMSDANPATGSVVSGGAFKYAILQAGASSITVDPTVAIAQVPAGARVWLAAKGGAGRIIAGSFDLVII